MLKGIMCVLVILATGNTSPLLAQADEVTLNPVQARITTVSAMRARSGPQVTAAEVARPVCGRAAK